VKKKQLNFFLLFATEMAVFSGFLAKKRPWSFRVKERNERILQLDLLKKYCKAFLGL